MFNLPLANQQTIRYRSSERASGRRKGGNGGRERRRAGAALAAPSRAAARARRRVRRAAKGRPPPRAVCRLRRSARLRCVTTTRDVALYNQRRMREPGSGGGAQRPKRESPRPSVAAIAAKPRGRAGRRARRVFEERPARLSLPPSVATSKTVAIFATFTPFAITHLPASDEARRPQ